VTLQPQYSLLAREIEWEIVPAALDAGMGLLPWSPLDGGWLSGKYKRDERPVGATRLGEDLNRGMEAYDRRGTERTWNVIDAVQKVAEDRGVSRAEVALAWMTDRPAVTSTILGARTVERPAYGVHALWPAGHLPDAEAEHRHLTSIREDAGGPVCCHCAGCHDGCSFALGSRG
jgi:aryl-alcohol dehydrogenase-like predicted oxidoreductase